MKKTLFENGQAFKQLTPGAVMAILIVMLNLLFLTGYGAHYYHVGVISDDIYGFAVLSQQNPLTYAASALIDWPQGRPLGQFFYALHFAIFSNYPVWLFNLWCVLLIGAQASLMLLILTRLGLSLVSSFFGAALMGFAPFYQSVYMPIHAAFTEFATIFFLLSIYAALYRRVFAASFLASASILFYEQMLGLILLPCVILFWRALDEKSKLIDVRSAVIASARPALIYFLLVLLQVVTIFLVRRWHPSTREAELSGLSLPELAGRAISAANQGLYSSALSFDVWHLATFMMAADTLIPSFIAACGLSLIAILVSKIHHDSPSIVNFGWQASLICIIAAIVIAWASYLPYVTPGRYPPIHITSRISNVHAGARIGFALFVAGCVQLALSLKAPLIVRISSLSLAAMFTAGLAVFSYSYGANASRVWENTVRIGEASKVARCDYENADAAVIMFDVGFDESLADYVVDWSAFRLPDMMFKNYGRLRILIANPHDNQKVEDFFRDRASGNIVELMHPGIAYLLASQRPQYFAVDSEKTIVLYVRKELIQEVFRGSQVSDREGTCDLLPRASFAHEFDR